MMRKFGRFTGKMRAMAFEFKQGFDELGRQAELEELRKEVADLKKHTGLEDSPARVRRRTRINLEKDVDSAMAPGQAPPAPLPPAPADPAAAAANGAAPTPSIPSHAGLSAEHPGYDTGEDFQHRRQRPASEPAPATAAEPVAAASPTSEPVKQDTRRMTTPPPDSGKPDPETKDGPVDEVEASRAPLMDHLLELRTRLVRILWCIGILFIGGWFVAQPVLEVLLTPLADVARKYHPEATADRSAPQRAARDGVREAEAGLPDRASGRLSVRRLQVYGFVAPGLYKKERAAVLPFLFVMPLLFAAGALVVYYLRPAAVHGHFLQPGIHGRRHRRQQPQPGEAVLRDGDLAVHRLRLRLPASRGARPAVRAPALSRHPACARRAATPSW